MTKVSESWHSQKAAQNIGLIVRCATYVYRLDYQDSLLISTVSVYIGEITEIHEFQDIALNFILDVCL